VLHDSGSSYIRAFLTQPSATTRRLDMFYSLGAPLESPGVTTSGVSQPTALLPDEHILAHLASPGFRGGLLSDSNVVVASGVSWRLSKVLRWRLLGMALYVRNLSQPHQRCVIAWRVECLHLEMLQDFRVSAETSAALLRTFPSALTRAPLPLGPAADHEIRALMEARRESQVLYAREGRSKFNTVTALLRRVSARLGHSVWKSLRGVAALVFFQIFRWLELKLTALQVDAVDAVRHVAVMWANVSHKLLGASALRGIEWREFQVDPCGLTPRVITRRRLPADAIASCRAMQEEAELALRTFREGLETMLARRRR